MPVYKDKKKTKGAWFVSYTYKDASTGKFHKKTKRGFETSKEARAWERENYTPTIGRSDITFGEVVKEWEDYMQSSKATRDKHRSHFMIRCTQIVGKQIKRITKDDLMEWRAELSQTDYSTRTKNTSISLVKSVFTYASEVYDFKNPAVLLKKFKMSDIEVMQEMKVWTPEEFNKFIGEVKSEKYKLFFEFLFWTGCRRGEAIALQKKDVSNGRAVIKYSQRSCKEGLKPTKTKQKRTIILDNTLWNNIQPLLQEPGDYLFGGQNPISPTTAESIFKKAIMESGVPLIRIHDLRHSHATWLINNGVNIVAVSKRLGHATIEQTLKTYTHLLETTDQNMMLKINTIRGTNFGTN